MRQEYCRFIQDRTLSTQNQGELSGSSVNIGALLGLLTALLWSIAVIFFKKSGEHVHPIALNLFKDVLAFTLFIPTSMVVGQALMYDAPMHDWIVLAISGVMGICLADTLFFYSLQLLGASLSAIINCLYSPAIVFFSIWILDERLTMMQGMGIGAIVLAVALATGSKRSEHLSTRQIVLGLLAGVGAVTTSGIGIVLMKPVLEHSPVIWVSEVRLLFGILGLMLVLLFNPHRRAIINSLRVKEGQKFTLLGSFFGAYLCLLPWAAGFKYGQASTTSALQQVSYLLVFVFALIFLKEKFSYWKVSGIVIGMVGIYMVTFG